MSQPNPPILFKDRYDAGTQLAKLLREYITDDVLLLALPRGGVEVGRAISDVLGLPLSVLIARKIGAPSNRELGVGALAEGGILVLDDALMAEENLKIEDLNETIKRENEKLLQETYIFRHNNPLPSLADKTVIIVDDGLATGVTASAAIKAVNKLGARKIIFAAPVCDKDASMNVSLYVDEMACLQCPSPLQAIGYYYEDFHETTDDDVLKLLHGASP